MAKNQPYLNGDPHQTQDNQRFFIIVRGGNVQGVVGTDAYDVIDFDNFNADARRTFRELSGEAQDYMREHYADELKKYGLS